MLSFVGKELLPPKLVNCNMCIQDESQIPLCQNSVQFQLLVSLFPISDLDSLMALCMGAQSCTSRPLFKLISYAHLSGLCHAFVSYVDSHSIPKSVSDTNLFW